MAEITPEARNTALTVLGKVAGGGSLVSDSAAAACGTALSSLASSATSPSSANGSATASNSAVLLAVLNVLGKLSESFSAGMSVPGEEPRFISTSTIHMKSSLDTTGNKSRLFTQPLTVPGAPSSFDPLSPGLFGSAAAVSSQFLALAFNPWASLDANSSLGSTTSGSVTRLLFTEPGSGGVELGVSGLPPTAPITFTMPAPASVPGGSGPACTFWNPAALTFSEEGCAVLPSPYPANHSVFWLQLPAEQPSYNASRRSNDTAPPPPYPHPPPPSRFWQNTCTATAELDSVAAMDARAASAALNPTNLLRARWGLTGPMACGCNVTVLDCAVESAKAAAAARAATAAGADPRKAAFAAQRQVFLSPRDALLIPAIRCAEGDNTSVLRVFYGEECALWQPANEYRCSWNVTKQSFVGEGCVSSPVSRCACLHLTGATPWALQCNP